MILVTGGTGLVGSHLLYKLLGENETVRAIYRRVHKLESVKKVFSYYTDEVETLFNQIEWVEADLNDIPALSKAFEGITHVYHCAAFISFEPDKYHQLRKINIEGTANIVNLCISNAVQKLCYVSSVAALGHHPDESQPIDEETPWNPEFDHSVYSITKYGAEIEVWRGTQEGVNAVIVNPGLILGPGYWHGGGSGSLIKRIYKGLPYYTEGTTGYVDVWDVVDAMVQLMQNDISKERYVLVAENISFKKFQEMVAKALGVTPATKTAPSFLIEMAWRLDWLRHKLMNKRRRLSKQMAKTAQRQSIFDNSKIKKDLDFQFKPIQQSIDEVAIKFLLDVKP